MVETKAPTGYATSVPVNGVVSQANESEIVTMTDHPIQVKFTKVDKDTDAPVAGAHLTLWYAKTEGGKKVKDTSKGEDGVYADWTTTADGSKTLYNIPIGDYILEEVTAPTDHGFVKSQSVDVTIIDTPELQVVYMKDGHTEWKLAKKDFTTQAEVKDAVLTLYKTTDGITKGEKVLSWKSGSNKTEDVYINFGTDNVQYKVEVVDDITWLVVDYIPVGQYIIEETERPEGYNQADSAVVTITETEIAHETILYDEKTPTYITKVDDRDGNPVIGATLTLYKTNEQGTSKLEEDKIESWETNGEAHLVEGLKNGWYLVEETNVPNGYLFAEDSAPFYVDGIQEEYTVEMRDKRPYGQIEIFKDDETGEKVDAEFTLYTDAQCTIPFIVDGEPFVLRTGTDGYVISDAVIPIDERRGDANPTNNNLYYLTYYLKETKVYTEGVALFTEAQVVNFEYVDGETPIITFTYRLTDKVTHVSASKKNGASADITGATLNIYKTDADKNLIGDPVLTWVTDGTAKKIDKLPFGQYALVESDAPDGYFLAETVYFTLSETNPNADVSLTDYRLTKLPSAGGMSDFLVRTTAVFSMMIGTVLFIFGKKKRIH